MNNSRPRKITKGATSSDASMSSKASDNESSSQNPSADEGTFQRVSSRTGIQAASPGKIPLEAGTIFEDMNAFFQSSRRLTKTHVSPNGEPKQKSQSKATNKVYENNDDDSSIKDDTNKNPENDILRKSHRQQQRQLEKQANSLKYQQHMANLAEPDFDVFINSTKVDQESEKFSTDSVKPGKYLQRIIKSNRTRNSSHLNVPQSPSELSHVSTIPPTPASKELPLSSTKSILRSSTGTKSQIDPWKTKDTTPFSSASDKSVRWSVDNDDSVELLVEESVSQTQGSGKKRTAPVNHDEMDDLYPNDADDEIISGLFVKRPSASAQETLNTSLDRAAALLPIPTSDMKRKSSGSTFDDDRSPPPLEDSMIEMLNNTDDMMNQEEKDEGFRQDVSDPNYKSRGTDFHSEEETHDFSNQNNGNNDYEDDEDKEGDGFALASQDSNDLDDEERDLRAKISKVKAPASNKETRESNKKDRKPKLKVSPVSPESPQQTSVKKKKKKKLKKRVANHSPLPGFKGHAVGNREYETIPVSDFQDDEDNYDDEGNVRRSKRARFKPLEYWRNEKLVYEAHHETGVLGQALGHMPIVSGVVRALPTPHAVRKTKRKQADSDIESDEDSEKTKRKGRKRKTSKPSESDEYDSSDLRKKYEIHDDDRGLIWSESMLDVCETQIVSYFDSERFVNLPTIRARGKTESKVSGKAVQSFNAPTMSGRICGWLSGLVELPPAAIKDAEGVGSCLQHFHVIECQPKALEFALANPEDGDGKFQNENAQRFLLSKGDAFYVPPGNVYRLENHSETDGCLLSYTIFRPFPETVADADKKGKR